MELLGGSFPTALRSCPELIVKSQECAAFQLRSLRAGVCLDMWSVTESPFLLRLGSCALIANSLPDCKELQREIR